MLVLVHLASNPLAAKITAFRLVLLLVFGEALRVSLVDNDDSLTGGIAIAHRLMVARIGLLLLEQRSSRPERLLEEFRSSPSRIGG